MYYIMLIIMSDCYNMFMRVTSRRRDQHLCADHYHYYPYYWALPFGIRGAPQMGTGGAAEGGPTGRARQNLRLDRVAPPGIPGRPTSRPRPIFPRRELRPFILDLSVESGRSGHSCL